ncbi:MAG: hypothetical protein KIT45_09460 [Fimbriimonadia bacterium]|nr:hypothetical protein [Fimbriimonadia bacterium]
MKLVAIGSLAVVYTLLVPNIRVQQFFNTQDAIKLSLPSFTADRSTVVDPDQVVFLQLTTPQPSHRVSYPQEGVMVQQPRWRAVGGTILYADPFWVVYQAPNAEGPAFLLYESGSNASDEWGLAFTVSKSIDSETDEVLPETHSQGYRGAFLPVMGSAPTQIHMSLSRSASGGSRPELQAPPSFSDREGNVRIQLPRKPMVPIAGPRAPAPGRPCNRPPSVAPSDHISESVRLYHEAGEITVTEQLSAELGAIGIQVEIGRKTKVRQLRLGDCHFDIEDCYACVNSRYQYKGSRINVTECHYVMGYDPEWVETGIERGLIGGFQPVSRNPIIKKWCKSSGSDCPCTPVPKTGAITRGCGPLE